MILHRIDCEWAYDYETDSSLMRLAVHLCPDDAERDGIGGTVPSARDVVKMIEVRAGISAGDTAQLLRRIADAVEHAEPGELR